MRSLVLLFVAALALPSLAQQYLLPAAGNAPGANLTHFRSDVAIWNFRQMNQRVRVEWLPQGTSGAGIPPVEITINLYSAYIDEDFVGNMLKQQGLGAILFTVIRPDGTIDPEGLLRIKSRIWTQQPGTNGFTSQSFDAIPVASIQPASTVTITGHRSDDRYRFNMGFVNLDRERPVELTLRTPSQTVTLPPFSMQQIAVPRAQASDIFWRVFGPFTGTWVVYGSSVDNVTGDAWSSVAEKTPPFP